MSLADVSRTLALRIRYPVVARHLARLGLVLVVLNSVPSIFSWWHGDTAILFRQLLTMAALGALCLPFAAFKNGEDIRTNEAMVITALSFLLASFAGILPFVGENLSPLDALFESVSAITTTGLSTITNLSSHSAGFLFERAWMQWYGGLGVAVFSIGLLLLDKGIASRRLALTDPSDSKGMLGSGRSHTRILIVTYCLLTVLAIVLLLAAGIEPFSAVTHALSGVSTGGFSIYDQSIGALTNGLQQLLVVLCGLAGAVSLPFYFRLYRHGFKEFSGSLELWGLISSSVLIVLLLTIFSSISGNFEGSENIRHAIILGLSAQTTTGFADIDIGKLDNASKFTLILAMLFGGSTGSTAGGIKILRLLIVLRLLQLLVLRTAIPAHAVVESKLGDDYLESKDIEKALMLILIIIGTVVLSWLPFLAAGYVPLDALFEVVSACSTTGLSAGVATTDLESGLKTILIIDMLLGRVEYMAFIIFLYPRTWFGLNSST